MANHRCMIGAIRLPGKGWPVKCATCGRIGFGKTPADARKLGIEHNKNNSGK